MANARRRRIYPKKERLFSKRRQILRAHRENKKNLDKQVSAEIVSKITPIFTGLLATLIVFTIQLWNTYPRLTLSVLYLLLFIPLGLCLWRLVHFCRRKNLSKKLKAIFIPVYIFLLIVVIVVGTAGYLYYATRQLTDNHREMYTFMTVQRRDGLGGMTPVSAIPYGRGQTRRNMADGTNVFVLRQATNSHGNIWSETDYGWIYSRNLVEISDIEKLQELMAQRYYDEAQRSHVPSNSFVIGIAAFLILLVAILLARINKGKRDSKKRKSLY